MIEIIQNVKEVSFSLLDVIICVILFSILNRGIKLNKFEKRVLRVAALVLGVGVISSVVLILNKVNII